MQNRKWYIRTSSASLIKLSATDLDKYWTEACAYAFGSAVVIKNYIEYAIDNWATAA